MANVRKQQSDLLFEEVLAQLGASIKQSPPHNTASKLETGASFNLC